MANPYFQFKQFTVRQSHAAMKVGTDGVLLGAWAHCHDAKKILDIGTGTGLIALMLAQRSNAYIDALEIDAQAAAEAQQNVAASPWSNRITVINNSLQQFETAGSKYDLIVSNPPYFQNSLQNPSQSKTAARHNSTLNPDELIKKSVALLHPMGSLEIIIPAEQLPQYETLAQNCQLHLNNILSVLPVPNAKPVRVLCRFSFQKYSPTIETLVIEDKGRHGYSDDYIALTKDFYLKF